ncbi:MAG: SDR family NAD(P)-dependent oxidoreductase [Chloroflexota bacterium]
MHDQAFCEKYGPWAIVTGASAGIGAEFARQIAGKGVNVVLVARRRPLLETLAQELHQDYGIEARAVSVDLTRPDFLSLLQEATSDLEINLLINNAGKVNFGDFLDNTLEDELRAVDLNVRATVALCHAYGGSMAQRRRGGIAILSSSIGFIGMPKFANYAATKAYDLLLAEGLAEEFKGYGVDVLAVTPGFTKSEYLDSLDLSQMPMDPMDTDVLVAASLEKLGSNTRIVMPGAMNQVMYMVTKLLGRRTSTAMMAKMVSRLRLKSDQGESAVKIA